MALITVAVDAGCQLKVQLGLLNGVPSCGFAMWDGLLTS